MIIDPKTLIIPHFEDILQEQQEAIKEVLDIPKGVKLQPESVGGQLASNCARQSYELFLSFQALIGQMDARTANGFNLDKIASIRGLKRLPNETDDDFRKRVTGFNKETENLKKKDLLLTQLENIEGINKANVIYKNGEIWTIVNGGSDKDICDVLTKYSPLGVHKGDSLISCDCKNYRITRARELPIKITIAVNTNDDRCICKDEDLAKIPEIVRNEICDYTAGSALKEDHLKNLLGRKGFTVKSVYFEVQSGKILTWNKQPKQAPNDVCQGGDIDDKGGWNGSCWNEKCKALAGRNILLPHNIIPKICTNMILVTKA